MTIIFICDLSIFRSAFFALLAAQVISRVFVESQNQFTINIDRDQAIDEKYVFKTLVMAGKGIDHCLGQCLQDCLCLSFQICHMTECQLCSSNKYKNSTELQSKKGCTNFVFERQYPEVMLKSIVSRQISDEHFVYYWFKKQRTLTMSMIHCSIKNSSKYKLSCAARAASALLARARYTLIGLY